MALYQFLCSVAVVIILSGTGGCALGPRECGKMMKGHHQKVWPWQAVIGSARGHMCMGVLISNQWVMTTRNCGFEPINGTKVTLGRHVNQTQANQTMAGQAMANQTNNELLLFVKDVKCTKHASSGGKSWSGLCLLKLSQRVNFTDSIYPICLPSEHSTLHSELETYILTGAAYHAAVKVPLIGERKCSCFHPERSKGKICSGRRMHNKMDKDKKDKDKWHWDMVDWVKMEKEKMEKEKMDWDKMEEDRMDWVEMEEDRMDWDMMDACQPGMGMMMMMSLQDEMWTLTGVSICEDEVWEEPDMPLFFEAVSTFQEWIMEVTGSERSSFLSLYTGDSDPDSHFECKHVCSSPGDCYGSVLDDGANMTPASPFIILCVLALSLCFTKW